MKVIVKIFLYSSIIALIYYLFSIDYDTFKGLNINYLSLSASIFFLISGFLFSVLSWFVALKLHGVGLTFKQAVVSQGIPVFTKYIPGRVWTILGRAALIKDDQKSIKILSFISFKEQLIYLCLGILISIYPILQTDKIKEYAVIIILLTGLMFFILFSRNFQEWLEGIWHKIFKKQIYFPKLNVKEFLQMSLIIIIWWLLWAMGFYFLIKSVTDTVPLYFAFAFPLSIVIGLVSIIFPGGIGIREGVLILFLVSNGISMEISVLVSVLARIWFVLAEVILFITAMIFKKQNQALYNL